MMGELSRRLNADGLKIESAPVPPATLARLVRRIGDGTISNNAAKQVFDLLWSNAGLGVWKTVPETTDEEWERIVGVNLKGTFLVGKHGIPELVRAGGGTMVVTASISSFVGAPRWAAYCATKGGVLMLARAMALDHAAEGVRVNCVCPGAVDTPLQAEDLRRRDVPLEQAIHDDEEAHALGRFARPEEIARAALFLSCDDSSFCTGSALMVDGGLTAQ